MTDTILIGGLKILGRPALDPSDYSRRNRTDYLVVHCAATPPGWDGGADQIRTWHKARGWMDIGYHFVIRRNGDVEVGRPAWAVGAGVSGRNSNALHICLVGGTDNDGKAEDNFTEKQKNALRALLTLCTDERVYPKATVLGHRDFPGVKKDCPSFDVKRWWSKRDEHVAPQSEGPHGVQWFQQLPPKLVQ